MTHGRKNIKLLKRGLGGCEDETKVALKSMLTCNILNSLNAILLATEYNTVMANRFDLRKCLCKIQGC